MVLISQKQCIQTVSWCKNPVTSNYHWYIYEETWCKD